MISEKNKEAIERWIVKYPPERKQSAVMAALSIVQKSNGGWLKKEDLIDVAAYLELPPITVEEVASFYSMYRLKPVGRHHISVCTNVSCLLRGSDSIVGHLHEKLGIKSGETTADGLFSMQEVECLAACGGAPVMQINETDYENLTPEKIDKILESLKLTC